MTTDPDYQAGMILGCTHEAWGMVAECPYCGMVNDMKPYRPAFINGVVASAMSDLNAQREASVQGQIGLTFRQTVSVRVEKPRWLPGWAYRRLMRSIVVEESWPTSQVTHP